MSRQTEMQTVENLLRAVEKGEEDSAALELSAAERKRYAGCLVAAGFITASGTGARFQRFVPTATGRTLLELVRKLEEITGKGESVLELNRYVLGAADIDRIKTLLKN